nr:phosphatidylinositol 4-kinase alpha-like [Cherax quadricarinatus]
MGQSGNIQDSVDRHLGLFSRQSEAVDPLAAYEGCELKPHIPQVGPHDIWIKFISERIEIAKYDSDAQVAMFAGMFHRTLHMTVGNPDSKINRHICALGTRFRLLSCALTLIQDFTSYQYGGGASLSPSVASDLRSTSGEFVMTNGWINTVPLSSNTSTLSKRSTRSKRLINPDIYVKDYLKKRALILSLLAVEIQTLRVWLQPPRPAGQGGEVTTTQEEALVKWLSGGFNSPKAWSGNTNLAWSISPALAVFLPTRIHNVQGLDEEISHLVRDNPIAVSHLPDALQYLATSENILSDIPEMGYVAELIKLAAKKSQLLLHQLIWNMETNKYRDEEGHEKDGKLLCFMVISFLPFV